MIGASHDKVNFKVFWAGNLLLLSKSFLLSIKQIVFPTGFVKCCHSEKLVTTENGLNWIDILTPEL